MNNILMNKEMTKAILDGRKVQTRRVAKGKNKALGIFELMMKSECDYTVDMAIQEFIRRYSKYQVNDDIWVREPVSILTANGNKMTISFQYMADSESGYMNIPDRFIGNFNYAPKEWYIKPKWIQKKQGIPNGCIKEMARIFLKVTGIRVELLQDITFGDIIKEGYPHEVLLHHKILKHKAITAENEHEKDILNWWISTWNKTAKKPYQWANNPHTFVNEFERVVK